MADEAVGACGLAGVRAAALAADLTVDFCGLVLGLIVGVDCCTAALLEAYGSAVAGLASSGRLGRRTGADIRDDLVDSCDVWLPDMTSRDIEDGGLAVAALAAPGRVFAEADEDLTGEKEDWAELGRPAASAAFRCANIASRTDGRPAPSPGLAIELVLADRLDTDEAKEPGLGLRGSFSSWPLDFASRLFIILNTVLAKFYN